MPVQAWKNVLIATLIVMCVSLILICYQLAHQIHQSQADQAKEMHAQQVQIEELRRKLDDKTTRQAERHGVEPPSEQGLKDLAQGFAGLIAGPSPSATPGDP